MYIGMLYRPRDTYVVENDRIAIGHQRSEVFRCRDLIRSCQDRECSRQGLLSKCVDRHGDKLVRRRMDQLPHVSFRQVDIRRVCRRAKRSTRASRSEEDKVVDDVESARIVWLCPRDSNRASRDVHSSARKCKRIWKSRSSCQERIAGRNHSRLGRHAFAVDSLSDRWVGRCVRSAAYPECCSHIQVRSSSTYLNLKLVRRLLS